MSGPFRLSNPVPVSLPVGLTGDSTYCSEYVEVIRSPIVGQLGQLGQEDDPSQSVLKLGASAADQLQDRTT